LAVGLDGRRERLAEYPWSHRAAPTFEELVAELEAAGVHRFVIAHVGASPDRALLGSLAGSRDREVLVAVGAADLASIAALRDAGVDGVIVGEALFTGAIDMDEALRVASE